MEGAAYYTDGSLRNDAGVGGAWILIEQKQIEIKIIKTEAISFLKDSLGIFDAEIMMIKRALEDAAEQDFDKIHIFTDSQSSLRAIENPEATDEIAKQCQKIISSMKDVTLNWVPAHKGHKPNEIADTLAGLASKLSAAGKINAETEILKRSSQKMTKKWIEKNWIKLWAEEKNKLGPTLRATLPLINSADAIVKLNYLQPCPKAMWIVSNQIPFCNDQNVCDQCGVKNSVKHILYECPKTSKLREKHKCIGEKMSMHRIVGDKSRALELVEFANSTDWNRK